MSRLLGTLMEAGQFSTTMAMTHSQTEGDYVTLAKLLTNSYQQQL